MSSLSKRTQYPLSVDCVVFGYDKKELRVALIERKKEPYVGFWAIPGGFMEGSETAEEAAFRELDEETGIRNIYLEQFHVFSNPERDPRGRVITIAFFALVNSDQFELIPTEDAAKAKWWLVHELPELAFDHSEIFKMALEALRQAIVNKPIAFELLPKNFTLTQLQNLYEKIFGMPIDKRNFRKKVNKLDYLKPTGKTTTGGRQRPAMLYSFNASQYLKSTTGSLFKT